MDPFIGATEEDKFAFREGDFLVNFNPPVNAPLKESLSRSAEKLRIKFCLYRQRHAQQIASQHTDGDLRLLSAEEVFTCLPSK